MKKTKCIKSIIGIGTIGAIGLGVSVGIASCGKATTTDVVSFDNDYHPSVSTTDGEQIYHASSSMDGKISYAAVNLPDSGVDFDDSSGKLNYTTALPDNHDITINATSDKGGHSSIKITLLATPTPTPALSASISNNNLQIGTEGTATLSVTEINTTSWTDPDVSFGDASGNFTLSESWEGSGLTRTKTIGLDSQSLPAAGSYIATISLSGYDSISQTIRVLAATDTLVISPTTLANDQTLFADCNLVIDSSGVLNKKATWDSSTNTTFTTYLANLHITTIRFEDISSIDDNAFNNCTALTNIILPSSLTSIGNQSFYNCTSLTSIDLSRCISFTTATTRFAFGCTSLQFVALPSSLKTIGSYFITNSSIKFIDFSGLTSVTSIGENFLAADASLKFVDLSGLTSVTSIDGGIFYNDFTLSSVIIGSNDFSRGSLSLGPNAMLNIPNLASCTIHGAKAKEFKTKIGSAISNWTTATQ